MSGALMALDREDEAVRHSPGPLAVGFGRLPPIESRVDLDGGELGCGESELFVLGKAFRIERAAPGRKGPTADSGANVPRPSRAALCRLPHHHQSSSSPDPASPSREDGAA